MAYTLRSSCKMDNTEEDTTPPWLTKLLDDLQEQREQHRRDFNELRSEIQDLRRHPPLVETPTLEPLGPEDQGALPLASAGTDAVESRTPAAPPSSDAALPVTTASSSGPLSMIGAARRPTVTPPSKLSGSISLREFRAWRSAWNDYSRLCQLTAYNREDKLAFLRSCFTEEMRATSQHAVGINEASDTVQSALDKIEQHLRQQCNIAIDRVKFEETTGRGRTLRFLPGLDQRASH